MLGDKEIKNLARNMRKCCKKPGGCTECKYRLECLELGCLVVPCGLKPAGLVKVLRDVGF